MRPNIVTGTTHKGAACHDGSSRRCNLLPQYPQYAWQYDDDTDVIKNSYNNIAVLISRKLVPVDTQYRFRIREDYDFTLQLIKSGCFTVRIRTLSYSVPRMAAAAGGMTPFYTQRKKEIREANRMFVEEWPSVSHEVIKGSGNEQRFDVKVHWTLLKMKDGNNPQAVLKSRVKMAASAPRAAPKRQRKGRRALTSSSDDDDEDDDSIGEASSEPVERPKRKRDPPAEKCAKGWKGFGLVPWRDVPLEAATGTIGLVSIPTSALKLGDTVAIIPVWLSVAPNLVVVTIIGLARKTPVYEWTGVVENVRGAPMQTVTTAFKVPKDFAAKDAAIAEYLANQ